MESTLQTILGIVAGNATLFIPLFLWNRAEARADARDSANDTKQLRRELIDVMRSIDQEMKDFHGRLCALEEKRK